MLMAQTISGPLISVDEEHATVSLEQAQKGLSGVIVRHFDEAHTAIIANATVTAYDASSKNAELALTAYTGLQQNTLPYGEWVPQKGDQALIAPDYSRALLIAPDGIVYDRIRAAFRSVTWVHPDRFAAYLSRSGHPSPTQEDFSGFCTDNAVGLLYIYLESSLFTLDCKSLNLLQVAHAPTVYEKISLPFFTRVENIREALWGTGSSPMEQYAPYYLALMEEYNEESPMLKQYYKDAASDTFKRDGIPSEPKKSSWFGGLFDNIDVGLERDKEE
jgi:hypothetical protein